MKKIVLLASSLVFTASMSAQTTSKTVNGVRFGLSISPSIGWIKPKISDKLKGFDGSSDGTKLLFGGGINFDYPLAKNVSIMAGVDLNYLGGKLSISDSLRANPYTDEVYPTLSTSRQTTLNYTYQMVEVPITLKMKSNEMNYMQFYGQLGVSLGARIGGKVVRTDNYSGTVAGLEAPKDYEVGSTSGTNKNGDYLNLFRAALVIGAGVDYNVSKDNTIFLSVIFNNGFLDGLKDRKEDGASINARVNTVQLKAGVWF